MLACLTLAFLTLRAGLALRRGRRAPGAGADRAELRRRHLRIARPAVAMLVVGFAGGPISAIWLRDWEPLRSFHGWVGVVAVTLFVTAASIGWRLERGRSRAREAHGLLGALGLLAAAVAAVAGFILLP